MAANKEAVSFDDIIQAGKHGQKFPHLMHMTEHNRSLAQEE